MTYRYDIVGCPTGHVYFALAVGVGKIAVGTSDGLEIYRYPSGERNTLDDVSCSSAVLFGSGIAVGTDAGIRLYRDGDVVSLIDETARSPVALVAVDMGRDAPEVLLSLDVDGNISMHGGPALDDRGRRGISLGEARGAVSLTATNVGNGRVAVVAGKTCFLSPATATQAWRPYRLNDDLGPGARSWIGHLDDPLRLDVLVVESGTTQGRMSVFSSHDEGATWVERRVAGTFDHVASLDVDRITGAILVGEVVARDDGFPLNRRPRVLVYSSVEALVAGHGEAIAVGTGTANAHFVDVDEDGTREIVGCSPLWPTEVQVFKAIDRPVFEFVHRVLDRRDRQTTDIVIGDLDGDGVDDVISGSRWYRAPDWTPLDLPGLTQTLACLDINGDGRLEIVGTYGQDLSNALCWLERAPDEPGWLMHPIGEGDADWPHGAGGAIHEELGPIFVTAYHKRELSPPQVWRTGPDPRMPWHKETLADITYGEEVLIVDFDGDGRQEVIAGPWWFEWDGDKWLSHRIADETYVDVTRVRAADLTGNGRLDVVLTENHGDWTRRFVFQGRIAWFEQPSDPRDPWKEHVITMRGCPHSLDVVDIDGDGEIEIIVAEHDPFTADGEEVFCRLSIFKRLGPGSHVWSEHVIDTRFEHHVGVRTLRMPDGVGIVSQGWTAPHDLHLWSPVPVGVS